jgi:hypothetical protein
MATAMKAEYYTELCGNETFEVVDRPKDTRVNPLIWTFVYEYDEK